MANTDLQLPKIIEVGKPVNDDLNRMNPAIIQFVLQASMNANILKMRKLEESKIPVSVKTISMSIGTETVDFAVYPPWISFSLINDGGSAMTAWINEPDEPQSASMITSAETLTIDMTYPVIKHLYMKSAGTSVVRIYAKEGKIG